MGLLPLSLQVHACSLGSRLGETRSIWVLSFMMDRLISVMGFGLGISLLGHGWVTFSPCMYSLWDATKSPCNALFAWDHVSMHLLSFGEREVP